MNKLEMQSKNIVDENIEFLAQKFPNCIVEARDEDGNLTKMVDFDLLKQELSKVVVEGNQERYVMTWPDKKQAILTTNAPISKTLRPCREESVDFDNTENLYIEGDNLDVLKLLRETYLNKIKMIYIDPPYNTGHDFVYEDDFAIDTEEYLQRSNQVDDQGNKLFVNNDTNGRFHTDWLNMIYPRLKLSKDLLTDDGVIFISIGQDELDNTIKLCNEIFGEKNKLGIISRQMKSGGGSQGNFFTHNIDYVVVYSKIIDKCRLFKTDMSDELIEKVYNQIESSGARKGERYRSMGLYQASLTEFRPNQKYFIECPDGERVLPPCQIQDEIMHDGDGRWRWSKERFIAELEKGNIEFKETSSSPLVNEFGQKAKWNIYTKIWLSDRQEDGTTPSDLITKFENRHSSKELNFMNIPFDFAKPVGLIKYLIKILHQDEDINILDFFSGSATTAHAVMQLNAEDGGNRKYICVQIPEPCDKNSEAFKAGYNNICEIGKERIRRAGKRIKEENQMIAPNLDIGFRCLKLDTSNMKDIYYKPAELNQSSLLDYVTNIKEDRNTEDLLFQVMLDMGVMLSSEIKTMDIKGKKVFNVNDGNLVCCFDNELSEDVVTEIAKMKPLYAVFRDSSMKSDSVAVNFDQIFETYSHDTTRRII